LKNWIFNFYKYILFILIIAFLTPLQLANSQSNITDSDSITIPLPWFVSLQFGTQMSGIKDEDFRISNYSPLIVMSAGKWFSPELALQIGYKGYYFNTISDELKHGYSYYYGDILLNMHQLLTKEKSASAWNLILQAGSGYFNNKTYNRPNICAHFGIKNQYRINKYLVTFTEVSAIMGWDIYQGDEDILPGISLGINYNF